MSCSVLLLRHAWGLEVLYGVLGLNEPPMLTGAFIPEETLKMCSTYKTQVDGLKESLVGETMYMVKFRDEEDVLRHYETEKYELVQCLSMLTGGGNGGT
jgi:hypothetical protein